MLDDLIRMTIEMAYDYQRVEEGWLNQATRCIDVSLCHESVHDPKYVLLADR